MKKLYISLAFAVLAVFTIGSVTWGKVSASSSKEIVGTWFVKAPDAPFQYHMFVFNSDGTMQQANPDAGDTNTSDSDGKGIWVKDHNKIKGKFDEVTADRATGQFAARGEITFEINVDNNSFTGTASAKFYDLNNNLLRGPFPTALSGSRLTL